MRYRAGSILMITFTTLAVLALAAPVGWCQQAPSALTARTLFYRANANDDQLPPVSAPQPRPAAKTPVSRRTASVATVARPASPVAESTNAGTVATKQGETGGYESEDADAVVPAVQHLALRYNLLLIDRRNNQIMEAVDPARSFHEGECVALEFLANRSGYLYVLNEGSSGAWKPLFPSPQLPDESNLVSAQAPLRVPEGACFGIHPPRGEERIFVVLTRSPADVDDLQQSIRRENSGGMSPVLAQNLNRLKTEMENRLASRDLEIETVAQPQAAGERRYSVYIANASKVAYDQLSAEIRIRHE
jgi:hypothetical protein